MKLLAVTEFKAHCLELLEEVSRTGEGLILTKDGKPFITVSKSGPEHASSNKPVSSSIFVQEVGAILVPSTELVEWDALKS